MQVKLEYFKISGKFYTSADWEVMDDLEMYEIFQLAHRWSRRGTLPGIRGNHNNYFIRVTCPDHPALILPH